MGRLLGGGQAGRELPRPQRTVVLLWILGLVLWVAAAAGAVMLWVVARDAEPSEWIILGVAAIALAFLGGLAIALALIVKYAFSAAVSVKLMERALRDSLQKVDVAQPVSDLAGASHEEVVSLLSEIMENTLLDDTEKAAKRQLAKKHRQQALRREIEALIKVGKYRDAHQRLEEFRLRYATDGQQVTEMETQLSEALRQHEQTEISHVTEQAQRYMGLGLWERALELARSLAEQFPENPEASRLPETVRLEQGASRRQEQQRLYREIEHLVARKHWRQALRAAETLLENHPDSPEANTLRQQLDELRTNAAIAERKEWEIRIAEHIKTGRHREAYDLAVELMEKYPDSPQAAEIRRGLDQLKGRAGVVE
ncbi:MAG: tetratricopeptide repeat protein [Planctomycetota bacterium]|nr:tetratricopeptide repeat protein [Planctomycetota bacterium]